MTKNKCCREQFHDVLFCFRTSGENPVIKFTSNEQIILLIPKHTKIFLYWKPFLEIVWKGISNRINHLPANNGAHT